MWGSLETFVEDVRVINSAAIAKENDRKEKLNEIIHQFLENISLNSLIGLVDEGTSSQSKLVAQSLSFILDAENFGDILREEELFGLLNHGLMSQNVDIRRLCIEKIDDSGLSKFTSDSTLVNSVVNCILDEEISVAKVAVRVIEKEINTSKNRELFTILIEVNHDLGNRVSKKTCSSTVAELDLSRASTCFMRLLSLCISIVKHSPSLLSEEVIQPLLEVLKGRDVLLQINVINSIEELTIFREGFMLLQTHNITTILLSLTQSAFLRDNALRVLAAVAAKEVIFTNSRNIVKHLFNSLHSYSISSDTEACAFLKLIGSFGGSSQIASHLFVKEKIAFLELATTGREIVLVNGLDCISQLLIPGCYNFKEYSSFTSLFPKEELLKEISEYSESTESIKEIDIVSNEQCKQLIIQYYKVFATTRLRRLRFPTPPSNLVDILFHYLQKPLEELQCVSFKLLRNICLQRQIWGLNVVLSKSDHVQFLLNRELNFSRKLKEWRFSVVEAVVNHPKIRESRSAQRFVDEFKAFVADGPFAGKRFVEGEMVQTQVKVELES